jgi:hypothetical protein
MIRGYWDSAKGGSIGGWAFDDSDPGIRLMVRARLGADELGRTVANIPRADLRERWGRTDGAHGFSLALKSSLTEAQLTAFRAEAARPGSADWLPLPHHNPGQPRDPQLGPMGIAPSGNARQWANDGFWSDRAAQPQPGGKDAFPVFVIGAARSGTSALFAALIETTRYRGFVEGHVLDVAARMIADLNAHLAEKRQALPASDMAAYHLGQNADALLRAGMRELLRCAAAGYSTPFWVDKTPSREMTQSVPMLAETWPNARFIFMKRRALENVMSRRRKFPDHPFVVFCRDWAEIMSEWRSVRTSIPERFIELEQRTLLGDPAGVAARVGGFLALDGAEIAALTTRLGSLRTEVTDPSARTITDISNTGWSEEMVEIFRAVCGAEMAAYGYTWDERYAE